MAANYPHTSKRAANVPESEERLDHFLVLDAQRVVQIAELGARHHAVIRVLDPPIERVVNLPFRARCVARCLRVRVASSGPSSAWECRL